MSELQDKINNVKKLIKAKQNEIDSFEIDPDDYINEYEDMINETNEQNPIRIGNCEYDPAYVLKQVDETAYRCGLNDYVDGIDKSDVPDYQRLEEELEELKNDLADAEEALENEKE